MRFTTSTSGTGTETNGHRDNRKTAVALWTVQGLLAVLFLFAGISKLVLPIEELTKEIEFPELFIRFIGVCEVLGGLGLVLPGLSRIRPGLTPLAAAGLVVIMVGATVTTLAIGGGAGALFPFVVGLLLAVVAYGRTRPAPHPRRGSFRRPLPQPAG
jgi:uncharacterized membrane protein YphA (DoxX/SURF4 family)